MNNFLKIIIIFAVGFLTGFFILQKESSYEFDQFWQSAEKEGLGEIFVGLTLDFSDGKVINCPDQKLFERDTVFDLLKVCSDNFELEYEIYSGVGVFINQIDDKASGQDNKYWQYWVNDEYAIIAADKFYLKEGDVVEWRFTGDQF